LESYKWAFAAYREGALFTAFDVETTGLNSGQDRIVEFGAVKFDRQGPLARYSTLINPGIPMPADAGKVNGITDAMLAGQPPIEEVMPDFLGFIKNTVILAHNAPFDIGFVNESLARLYKTGGAPFRRLPNKTVDTLILSRGVFPGYPGYSLQYLARSLGLQAENAHRALDDARLCMEIFLACEGRTSLDVYK